MANSVKSPSDNFDSGKMKMNGKNIRPKTEGFGFLRKGDEVLKRRLLQDIIQAVMATWSMVVLLRPYKWRIILFCILTCIMAVPGLITPLLLRHIIDVAYPARDELLLVKVCLILLGILFFSFVFNVWATNISTYLANMVNYRLCRTVFHAVESLPMRIVEKFSKGMFIERAQYDVRSIAFQLPSVFTRLSSSFFTIIVALGIMFTIDIGFSIAILAIIPVNVLFSVLKSQALRQIGLKQRTESEKLSSYAVETIEGFEELKIYDINTERSKSLKNILRKLIKLSFSSWKIRTIFGQSNTLVSGLWGTGVLFVVWLLVFRSKILLGEAVAIGMYIQLLSQPVFMLLEIYGIIMGISVSAERIGSILSRYRSEQDRRKRRSILNLPINLIELKKLSFSYEDEEACSPCEQALKCIDFRVERGEVVLLIGTNGAGKSTLLRVLSGLDDVYDGEFYVNEHELKSIDPASYINEVSYAARDHVLFTGSIMFNLFGSRSEMTEKEQKLMTQLGVNNIITKLPDGYNTRTGLEDSNLSTGQQQLILLARALLKPFSLLLLDEITEGMDGQNLEKVVTVLQEVKKSGCAIVFATHNHELLNQPWVDRVTTLSEGVIISDVTNNNVRNTHYERYYIDA